MAMTGTATLTFITSAKRQLIPRMPQEVITASPVVKFARPRRSSSADMISLLDADLTCAGGAQAGVHRPTHGDMDKSNSCFENITATLRSLNDEELTEIVEAYITFGGRHRATGDRLNAFVDGLCHVPSVHAQSLLARHVILAPAPDAELVKRVLFVVARGIVESKGLISTNLIQAARALAFEQDTLPVELRQRSLASQARLILGIIAASVQRVDETAAHAIVAELETQLGLHDEAQSVSLRARREAGEELMSKMHPHHPDYEEWAWEARAPHREEEDKMVLLESLGNARMPRSLGHILSYVNSSTATRSMRRASVSALRHYDCEQSAGALIEAVAMDSEPQVRVDAYRVCVCTSRNGIRAASAVSGLMRKYPAVTLHVPSLPRRPWTQHPAHRFISAGIVHIRLQ